MKKNERLINPDGMNRYYMNSQGRTVLALKEDADDMLFIAGDKNNTTVVDTNKDGKQNDSDGIVVKTEGLLGQLTSYTKGAPYLMYSSTVKQSASAEADMLNVFHYAATNTTAEFSLQFYKKGGSNLISLGTYGKVNGDLDSSPGSSMYGVSGNAVSKSYHNHPSNVVYNSRYTESYSMGDVDENHKGGDSRKAIKNKTTTPNYVFFPKSTNLYNVTQYGIELVKKINNNAKNLKK